MMFDAGINAWMFLLIARILITYIPWISLIVPKLIFGSV